MNPGPHDALGERRESGAEVRPGLARPRPLLSQSSHHLPHLAEQSPGDAADRLPVIEVVAEGTVKNHISSILSKLGVRDRTRAVLRGLELGLR